MAPYTSSFISSATGYSGEQKLIDDLTREQIKLFGVDLLYMPRRMLNYDKLLHESTKNAFEMAMSIPMYIKSFDGYDNGMELLTKFGVRSADEITLSVSRSEFITYYSPFLKSYYESINDGASLNPLEGQTDTRPKEGDLIYFPFDGGIFEIKLVIFDSPFFQLGKGYIFEMQCEKFEYSGENFSTGYDNIDSAETTDTYYNIEFVLLEGGTGTYELNETVTLYSTSNPVLSAEDGDVITAEDEDVMLLSQDGYSLYNSAGFIEDAGTITATVAAWDKPNRKLTLTQFINEDPLQEDSENNVDVDKLTNSNIIGNTSGAVWVSTSSQVSDMEFNDDDVIQEEFDEIKIVDPGDESPFGFL